MPSPIDSRLVARAHQQQLALLRRTDALAAKVAACYDRLATRLMHAATGGHVGLRPAVHSAVRQTESEVLHVVEQEFPKLIRDQYAHAKEDILRTIPIKWFRMIVRHTESIQEDADPYRAKVESYLFPPLSPSRVNSILMSPGHGGLTWQERFRRYSGADQDSIARELTTGVSSGEAIPALKNRIENIVAGPSYKAQRIARTEGGRIASAGGWSAFEGMGDMIEGRRRLCIVDEHSRPDHARTNGKLYSHNGHGDFSDDGSYVAKDGEVFPGDHYEPNCRCSSVPELKLPDEIKSDPRVMADFATAAGDDIPDPQAHAEWFANADEDDQRQAVGARRYQVVTDKLLPGHDPEWIDFIDDTGAMVPLKDLKTESHADREERKADVRDMLNQRETLYSQMLGPSFSNSRPAGTDARATITVRPRKIRDNDKTRNKAGKRAVAHAS